MADHVLPAPARGQFPKDAAPGPQPNGEITQTSDVVEALGRIPDPGRTALVMRHVEGLSVAEIAGELGRTVEATDSILRRSRQRLRDEYNRVQQGSIDR
jgi:DNA-directed RNA polymerase specialized sigma24 family protein